MKKVGRKQRIFQFKTIYKPNEFNKGKIRILGKKFFEENKYLKEKSYIIINHIT